MVGVSSEGRPESQSRQDAKRDAKRAPPGGKGSPVVPSVALFPKGCRVLAVGDGDFQFTEALAAALQPLAPGELVATCYDSEFEVVTKYTEGRERLKRMRAMGADVRCAVDATALGEGPVQGCAAFDRIVFNFPLLPQLAHPTSSGADVQVANRAMLVAFLREAAPFLKADGLLIIASKDCYPYSWWRVEAMPKWTGGELGFAGMLPWEHTEYPSLYDGPCNVNRDAAVKPTDAMLFFFTHKDHDGGVLRCVGEGLLQGLLWTTGNKRNSGRFRCEICRVAGLGSEQDLAQHVAGKIHKKRVNLEQRWEAHRAREAAASASFGDSLRQRALRTASEVVASGAFLCPCLGQLARPEGDPYCRAG